MNKRNCEKCGANYSTGKSYGDYWSELSDPSCERKGLCEFCNPNSYVGAVFHSKLCTTLVCNGCEKPSTITGDYCKNTTKEEKTAIYRKNMYEKHRPEQMQAFELLNTGK